MLTALEIEDLKHRWSGCFVAVPNKNMVGIFNVLEAPKGEKVLLSVSGTEKWVATDEVDFKVPTNQYVNMFYNREQHGIYVYKTGARFYKKRFSVSQLGGHQSKMFDVISPLYGKIRALNCLVDDLLLFSHDTRLGLYSDFLTSGQIVKSQSVHTTLAEKLLLKNDTFVDIKTVLELVLNDKSLGLAISPQFFIGLSSNEDYDAELYCGLISVGFIKAKTKTIFVNGPIAQEVSDFLISSGQTEYEIISI